MIRRSGRSEIVDPSKVVSAIDAFRSETIIPIMRRVPINGETYRAAVAASGALKRTQTALKSASNRILIARGLTLSG